MKKKVKNFSAVSRALRRMLGKTLFRQEMDEKNAIFVHIPKAAGTSVCKAVFNCSDSSHYTARCYRSDDPKKFKTYFKFTVVRNPYERFCSAYNYLKNGGERLSEKDRAFRDEFLANYTDINDFAENGLDRPEVYQRPHFDRQYEYLYDDDQTTLLVDFVGRLESLDAFSKELTEKLNTSVEVGHQNKTNTSRNKIELSENAKRFVYKHYQRDFELLGYEQ